MPPELHQRAALTEQPVLLAHLAALQTVSYVPDTIRAHARRALPSMRDALRAGVVNRLLNAYPLASAEGVALLGLAEAWLRVPDRATRMQLLRDKLEAAQWRGAGALDVGLRGIQALLHTCRPGAAGSIWAPLVEPLVSRGVNALLTRMAMHYVFGADIDAALVRAHRTGNAAAVYSFDMLGEAARTEQAAERYRAAYHRAIEAVGTHASRAGSLFERDGISIKLSALHCRYEAAQRTQVLPRLAAIVTELAVAAKRHGIGLTIDAEESERLGMSLQIVAALCEQPRLREWNGLGVAVQGYQLRAGQVLQWLDTLAARTQRVLQVRLVKGAYWDAELKLAQEQGLAGFPVYTTKAATDVAYLACARQLLASSHLYPAFATHNAWSAAAILQMAPPGARFEFQRLHGMGEGLYETLLAGTGHRCRVYAPVGPRAELLAYLVRRLLENGANGGFLQQLAAGRQVETLKDPVAALRAADAQPDTRIAQPMNLYGAERRNSNGMDLSDPACVRRLEVRIRALREGGAASSPLVGATPPMQHEAVDVSRGFERARLAQHGWQALDPAVRAAVLERMAGRMEEQGDELIALLVCEAKRCIPDAVSELREAVDFCRYYAAEARRVLQPQKLPGPSGEINELTRAPRGVFVCISPWNFPLAIFTGQVVAALVTGNAVLAKPAPQTPLVAMAAIRIMHESGVPADVLQLVCGDAVVGARLTSDAGVDGVAFTGSLPTARRIATTLLEHRQALVPLIAETGGLNTMLVDATALPEQVVGDVLTSAFRSAGQRCSALRLLCVQEECAERLLAMLIGAMAALRIGDPADIATDVGPVIDAAARERLEAHVARNLARVLYRSELPEDLPAGEFVAPTLIGLDTLEDLREEIFGPILHVAMFRAGEFEATLRRINALGFGLTMGLHTRIRQRVEQARALARVGNLYVNRSMIGAVVGTQPFGGEGLSGTGPKAGGPHYLDRFLTERTISDNTAATGGNVELLAL